MFTIDFGGTIKSFCNLEDKFIYVKYKSEDKNGGTELWVCDLRGENRQLILESDEALFMPKNYISNYILGYTSKGGVTKNYILNISTGEIKEIQ